jgi:hypothetical protein
MKALGAHGSFEFGTNANNIARGHDWGILALISEKGESKSGL